MQGKAHLAADEAEDWKIAEINAEIEEAKKFRPALKTYIIATTVDNDVAVTDHVNAISARHAAEGLFRVTVFGWRELTRRIDDFPELKEKHFDIITLRQLKRTMPARLPSTSSKN